MQLIQQPTFIKRFPGEREVKKLGKRDGANQDFTLTATIQSKFFYSAYMIQLVRLALVVIGELAESHYLAIEGINGTIRQTVEDFQFIALKATKKAADAKDVMQFKKPDEQLVLRKIYSNSIHEYEMCRHASKKAITQKKGDAMNLEKQIRGIEYAVTTHCEKIIAVYWKKAKENFSRLSANPPTFMQLMMVSQMGFAEIVIESGMLTDTDGYLRLEGMNNIPISPQPSLGINVPQMLVANEEDMEENSI